MTTPIQRAGDALSAANQAFTILERIAAALDLGNPNLDWVKLANGMGVEAARTNTLEGVADLMRQSFASDRPFLIEMEV